MEIEKKIKYEDLVKIPKIERERLFSEGHKRLFESRLNQITLTSVTKPHVKKMIKKNIAKLKTAGKLG